jgi:hypothetical protein
MGLMSVPDPNQVSVATFDKLARLYANKYFDLVMYKACLARFCRCRCRDASGGQRT